METSKIQWTESTWNPWHGCKKVGPGCKYCYMFRDKERYGQDPSTVLRSKTNFNTPLKWRDSKLIFTCSWSDFFIEEADQWRPEAWEIIKATPQHTYQVLTKRPERILEQLPDDWGPELYSHVWLGVTGENEECAYSRMRELLKVPAEVRFLSAEPLLEDITSPRNKKLINQLDWLIVGGESGFSTGKYRYRPMELSWLKEILDHCRKTHKPAFNKQIGTHLAKALHLKDSHGGNAEEWLPWMNVRQFPKTLNTKLYII